MSRHLSFSITESCRKITLAALLIFVILLACTNCSVPKTNNTSDSTKSEQDSLTEEYTQSAQADQLIIAKDLATLMVSVSSFKKIATTDYASALLTLSKGRGMEQLHTIDITLWDAQQAQLGWMFFFEGAIAIYAENEGKFPIVGFYNPYTDIFLITVWEKEKEIYKVVDAELLMGDWVRKDDQDFDISPAWLRGIKHRQEALGLSVAQSLLSFEKIFAGVTGQHWRTKLTILHEHDILDFINYPGATIRMNKQLLNILHFITPNSEENLKQCKKRTTAVMDLASQESLNFIWDFADATPSQTIKNINSYPGEWFFSLKVANILNNSEGCLVFFTHPQQTSKSLSLFFKRTDKFLHIKRLDLIDYQYFYDEFKSNSRIGWQGGVQ